jgi:hypothetical protein
MGLRFIRADGVLTLAALAGANPHTALAVNLAGGSDDESALFPVGHDIYSLCQVIQVVYTSRILTVNTFDIYF